jgi:hypothetical protein
VLVKVKETRYHPPPALVIVADADVTFEVKLNPPVSIAPLEMLKVTP